MSVLYNEARNYLFYPHLPTAEAPPSEREPASKPSATASTTPPANIKTPTPGNISHVNAGHDIPVPNTPDDTNDDIKADIVPPSSLNHPSASSSPSALPTAPPAPQQLKQQPESQVDIVSLLGASTSSSNKPSSQQLRRDLVSRCRAACERDVKQRHDCPRRKQVQQELSQLACQSQLNQMFDHPLAFNNVQQAHAHSQSVPPPQYSMPQVRPPGFPTAVAGRDDDVPTGGGGGGGGLVTGPGI